MRYDKELIVLGPDLNMGFLFDGLLPQVSSMGMRVPSYRFDPHPFRDAGCLDADELLESQVDRYEHAIVVANAERSGRAQKGRIDIECGIEEKLHRSGWGPRARAVIVDPGIGRWLLGHVIHEPKLLGTAADVEDALRRRRIPQSPELYRKLGERLLSEGNSDPAWQKILATLKDWFAASDSAGISAVENVRDLFSRIDSLSRSRKLDDALDLLFENIDDLLSAGNFAGVNRLLGEAPLATLDPSILIGILTITYAARDSLREARPRYVELVRERLTEIMGPEDANGALRGLE